MLQILAILICFVFSLSQNNYGTTKEAPIRVRQDVPHPVLLHVMYNVVNPFLHHPHHHHHLHHLPLPRHHLDLPEWMDQWDHKDLPDQMALRDLPGPSGFQALSVFQDFPAPQQVGILEDLDVSAASVFCRSRIRC